MTELSALLARRIAATGPITVADYMAECLLHPTHGYYATRDPFGSAGDFTTAPEISQMYGEMLGLFLAQVWIDQGRPAQFTLAEPGPGRGTLMADILRATRAVPGFHTAAQVHLVEASATLRQIQRDKLGAANVTWCDAVSDLPDDQPLYLVANEFFDALPIRQFQRDTIAWREVNVVAPEGTLAFGLSAPAPLAALDYRQVDTKPGDIVEFCPAAGPIITEIAQRLATQGGVALIVDYGGWRSLGDTLQALKAHQPVSPLSQCGDADLTAHVDFEALDRAAAGLTKGQITNQGAFLERLGITERAQALAQNLKGTALGTHIDAHRRLTHPQEMGTLFKAYAMRPLGAPDLPGFAE